VLIVPVAHEMTPGRHVPAKVTEAEVLMSDQTYVRVRVLGWHKLDQPFRQVLTDYPVIWLVQLRLEDGMVNWYEYVRPSMRPRR
jgi:hypothetical protein